VLLDARLAQAKDTHRVQGRRIRIIPGHAAGLHVHNGPVVGSIVDGSAVYQVE
jgi:quercetin dioxygenase-like cupin family protein